MVKDVLNLFGRTREAREQMEQRRRRLYRMAYAWTHNAALADDLVQDTMSKALQKSEQLRDPKAANAWLFSILSNCYRDYFRRLRETVDIENTVLIAESTPESEHSQYEVVHKVRKAISRLPEGQRMVVTLVDLEGFSYVEVANILNIPIGTVMSRLCRARGKLRDDLLSDFNDFNISSVLPDIKIRRIK